MGESSRNFQKKLRVLVLESHSSSSLFFSILLGFLKELKKNKRFAFVPTVSFSSPWLSYMLLQKIGYIFYDSKFQSFFLYYESRLLMLVYS